MIWVRWGVASLLCLWVQMFLLPDLLPAVMRPDLLLLLVLWTAVRIGPARGMLAGAALGLLIDAATLNPMTGVTALCLLAGAFLPVLAEMRLLTGGTLALVLLAAAGVVLADVIRYLLYQGAGYIPASVPFLVSSIVWDRVVITAIVTAPFLRALDCWVSNGASMLRFRGNHAAAPAR